MEQVMQKYCLRWNNYQTNLVRVFDEMLKNENFTDVTIVCNDGIRFRCHRMLLAACSKFFQDLFISVPGDQHLVMLLKDVKHTDMKHILEYMYTGEVNVAQEEISSIIRTAEELKIKGLIGEDKVTKKEEEPVEEAPPSRPTSGHMHSNSNMHSPPHSNNAMYKNPYSNMYSKMHTTERNSMPMWHVPGLPLPPVAENPSSNHFSVPSPPNVMPTYEQHNQEVYHHRRKKFSSVMMPKDTPILRTVLGQGQTDSSQPVSLVMSHAETKDENQEQEPLRKHMKEEVLEDAPSPYSDQQSTNGEDVKPNISASSPVSHSYPEMTLGIANYVPAQKPEWKRYKQYSRENLNCAIQAVADGNMSALQAAKKYNVPSRTLYDKVKKLGIVTTRSFKRGSQGNFRYLAGRQTDSPYHTSENEDSPTNNNSRHFFQRTIDKRGEGALKAMAMVAAMHAAASQHQSQSQNMNPGFDPGATPALFRYMHKRSPSTEEDQHSNDRSYVRPGEDPNPNGEAYTQQQIPHRSPSELSVDHHSEMSVDQDDDQVEDLSVKKRQEGVIVSPMPKIEENVKEANEEERQEMCVEEVRQLKI